jgi:hypothetical protein
VPGDLRFAIGDLQFAIEEIEGGSTEKTPLRRTEQLFAEQSTTASHFLNRKSQIANRK